MATVEELKRLKKRKKIGAKAKSSKAGGAGQDYVTSGKGDLSRKDYVDVQIIKGGKDKPITQKDRGMTSVVWRDSLYSTNMPDPQTKRTLAQTNAMMFKDEIYITKARAGKGDTGRNDKLNV